MNMADVIVPKSDQINSDDLIGRDMTITIRDVQIRGGQEQPVSILFEGSDKAFRPCKSMSRVLVAIWGADARQYIGRSLTLYRDPTVKWGGMEVGGIRISHMSDMEKPHTMALTATKGSRKPYTVKPLTGVPVASTAPAAITLEQAELDVRGAATMDDLQNVWKRKVMAPHRDALAELLNERKAELAFAPAAEVTPDQTATSLIAQIADEKTSDALDSLMARAREQVDALPDDLQETVRAAYYARFEKLSQ